MKKLEDMTCRPIDGRQQIILNATETVYCVKHGRVFLHFAELDENGFSKRKHYIDTLIPGQCFLGGTLTLLSKEYALVATGECESEVYEINVVIKDNEIDYSQDFIQEILEKMNGFYLKTVEQLEGVQQLKTLNPHELEANNLLVMTYLKNQVDLKEIEELKNLKAREELNTTYAQKSHHALLRIFGKVKGNYLGDEVDNEIILYSACKKISDHMRIDIAKYSEIKSCMQTEPTVEDIARVSKFAVRDVILEENWWKNDNGPLLLRAIEDERPLICLPISPSRYKVCDIKNKTEKPLTAALASEMIPSGYMFYRPFPNKKLGYRDLMLFGFQSCWKRDIVKLLAATLVTSLIGLLLPELNQRIFDDYIPEGDGVQLVQMGLLTLSFMVGSFFVSLTKSFATFRGSNAMEYAIQAATFDRLMNFPSKFYNKYTSGDLASRAMGITSIFNTLADVAISTFLSSLFSLLYLWRMFHYSKQLSYAGLIMVAISIAITLAVGYMQIKYEKKLIEISNHLSGFMYQLILGISKIRISGSQDRAVYKWYIDFLKTRELIVQKERMTNWINAFNNLVTTLFTVVIYYLLIVKKIEIAFGAFMAYSSAFGSFSSAMMDMANAYLKVNNLVPIYEKAKPLLEEPPEYEENMELVSELSGAIEVSNVNFKYTEEGPSILKNLNFSIKPGEYVGVVGPSGGGKSTLLKVLLGFETVNSGKVFYDDVDLLQLDKRELRKKLGVVLQEGQLISGSIYENITITNSKISMQSVRDVVKAAGLEEDIAKMPMGLYTNLMEDAGTISGGQKQRILIARAIVNKPKIVFFDEATSALDNITQAIVCESLEKLQATRVVIAHRLSTIVNCDRILVMNEGQIVEQGTYNELLENKGLFYELVSRQIA